MNQVTQADARLVELYREFSEDTACAGWLADPEAHIADFADYLSRYDECRSDPDALTDYEYDAIPVLRAAAESVGFTPNPRESNDDADTPSGPGDA